MGAKRRLVLALDEGTTGTTAILFDASSTEHGRGYVEIPQHYPQPGWVEHDAEDLWDGTKRAARAALEQAKAGPEEVAAIGITNQRETLVAWDARSGRPLSRAIVWQDRRTADACRVLKEHGEEGWISKRTGLRLDPYFSGSKLAWMVRNDPRVQRARAQGTLRFGTVDSWLLWRLTEGAVHGTDASNASRTLLFDLKKGRWDSELCRAFQAKEAELPQVLDSSGALGEATRDFIGRPVPVSGIAGDQQAALFGQACFQPGQAKNTYGTGCFLLAHTGRVARPPKGGLLSTVAWRLDGRTEYALEGAVFIAGAAVQWLRDGLGIIRDASETQAMAESIPDTGGVVMVPAFTGLGAPYWDPYARGLVVGITRGTGRAHLARAALESISFQSHALVDLMSKQVGRRIRRLRVDGGATNNGFLMQHQADVLGIPIERSAVVETTALGAAFLAGLAQDVWKDRRDIEGSWRLGARFTARQGRAWRKQQLATWSDAVRRSMGWTAPRSS